MKTLVRESGRLNYTQDSSFISRPLHGLWPLHSLFLPAINRWATISRPLCGLPGWNLLNILFK